MLRYAYQKEMMKSRLLDDAEIDEVYSFDTTDELVSNISKFIKENDTVLVKASRGMHFEKIVDKITEENKWKDI